MGTKLGAHKIVYAAIVLSYLSALSSFTVAVKKNALLPLVRTTNALQVTAFECEDLDKAFSTFALCSLKPINRTLKEISVRVILHQTPVTKTTVRLKVWKRANGFKPFGIEVYFDACKFLAGKSNIVFEILYKIIRQYTNMNHTCPFYSDLIVDKAPIMNISLPSVFPEGLYRVDLIVYAYNIPKAVAKVFAKVAEIDYFV